MSAADSSQSPLFELVTKLRRRQVTGGSTLVARLVTSVLRAQVEALAGGAPCTVGDVSDALRRSGGLLTAADRSALVIPFAAARAQRLLAEEVQKGAAAAAGASSSSAAWRLAALDAELRGAASGVPPAVLTPEQVAAPFTAVLSDGLLDGLAELLDELENLGAGLESCAGDILRPGDGVLTVGHSRTISSLLLRSASRAAPLDVFVAEGGPGRPGHAAAVELAAPGTPNATGGTSNGSALRSVVLLPDAGVWALLSSGAVRKVILPAHAIARDGSAVVAAGALSVALAAQHFKLPVILCVATTKLAPDASADALLQTITGASCLRDAISASSSSSSSGATMVPAAAPLATAATVEHLPAPVWDVLPHHLVSLIATNAGAAVPGAVWRLAEEAFGGLRD